MGTITATGAIIIITGWFTLVEFDQFSEQKRIQVMKKVKKNYLLILLIALMPLGIIVNVFGSFIYSIPFMLIGSSLIFIQGLIVSFLFWNYKRWKSVVLFVSIVILGIFIYVPFIIL